MTTFRRLICAFLLCVFSASFASAQTNPIQLLSRVSSTMASANGASTNISFSADGTRAVFVSNATNLVPNDTNGVADVFVVQIATGYVFRVSVTDNGDEANKSSGTNTPPVISADGTRVAFTSQATNLISGSTPSQPQVYVRDLTSNNLYLISKAGTAIADAPCGNYGLSISGDGQSVAFTSAAHNLISGVPALSSVQRIYLWNSGQIDIASGFARNGSLDISASCTSPRLSSDGKWLAFSTDTDISGEDKSGSCDIYLKDLSTGAFEWISRPANGVRTSSSVSLDPQVSSSGRYVAYVSNDPNIVAGDTNGKFDAFVRDRLAQTTQRANVGINGEQTSYDIFGANIILPNSQRYISLSADGQYLAFSIKDANTLIPLQPNAHLFVRDLLRGFTFGVNSGYVSGGGAQFAPSLSATGRWVAFQSDSPSLATGDTNGATDVFFSYWSDARTLPALLNNSQWVGAGRTATLNHNGDQLFFSTTNLNGQYDSSGRKGIVKRDFKNAKTTFYPIGSTTVAPNAGAEDRISVSADGRWIVFASSASNMVPLDTNGCSDVFLYDTLKNVTQRISVSDSGIQGNKASYSPKISANGRYVIYLSIASNLVSGDSNGAADLFLYDRIKKKTERISDSATSGDISADGRFVLATSAAGAILKDRLTGVTKNMAVDAAGTAQSVIDAILSPNGRIVAFTSASPTVVPGVDGGFSQLYAIDRIGRIPELVTSSTEGNPGMQNTGSIYVDTQISRTGRYIKFGSYADDLTAADTHLGSDVFVKDRASGALDFVSVGDAGYAAVTDQLASYGFSIDGSAVALEGSNQITAQPLTDSWGVYLRKPLVNGAAKDFSFNLLFQNSKTGGCYAWRTDGVGILQQSLLWTGGDVRWKFAASADLYGDDGREQIFQYQDGTPIVWTLSANQQSIQSTSAFSANGVPVRSMRDWAIVGTADLNRDGKADILLQHRTTGAIYYWLMDGVTIKQQGYLWSGDIRSWRYVTARDCNDDGTPDILLQNNTTGAIILWTLAAGGTTIASAGVLGPASLSGWKLILAADCDSDGVTELYFQHQSTGAVHVWNIKNAALLDDYSLWPDGISDWQLVAAGDIEGNYRSNLVLQNKNTGSLLAWILGDRKIDRSYSLYSNTLLPWTLSSVYSN